MTDPKPAMQPTSLRFLDFPREIRDAVYTHFLRREYTVQTPQHLPKPNDWLKATAQESDSSHNCSASISDTANNSHTASSPRTCSETAQNMRTSLSHSFAILQTCKQVNEEGTQLLYAVGSFHFPSDVLRQVDLSSLGHKLSLLRNVKLHFDMWWDKYPNTSRDLEGLLDDTCMDNISLLAAGERVRRYVCTLVFENCEMRGPSEVKWWDALEELDVFERVVVELEFQDPKTYPRSKEVSGRLERWEEIKQDVRMYIELYWDDVLDWQRRCGRV